MRLLATALALTLLGPIQAGARQAEQQVTVSYADLDLRSQPGVRTFDRRLDKAIRTFCAENTGSQGLRETMAARNCIKAKTAEVATQRDHVIAAKASRTALAR